MQAESYFKDKKITVMGHRLTRKPLGFPTLIHKFIHCLPPRGTTWFPDPLLKTKSSVYSK